MLISLTASISFSQIDTLIKNDNSFSSIGSYTAKDSIISDIENQKIHLYGDASFEYEDVKLKANYILYDLKLKELFASYTKDSLGNKIGSPTINQGGEIITAGTIRFNIKSKKGYIQEIAIKQDETTLRMENAKRHANSQVHFKDGKFSTCDLEEPHFHFHLSKAILIPEKKIVSKRMNIYIRSIATPIGLPFLIIPQQKNKVKLSKHGFLIPKLSPLSLYGMGISDLGYYIPINDSLQTTFLANIFTSGSWLLSNTTDYNIKYKYNGSLTLSYQQNNSGFPNHEQTNKGVIFWNHRKDIKSNPYWNFNSNVNFISDNNPKNTPDPSNPVFFNNTFKSDINLTRSFPNKPILMGLKLSSSQNSTSKNIELKSPEFTTTVTRFYPIKRLHKSAIGPDKWYDKIGVSYNLEGKNSAAFNDSLLKNKDFKTIQNKFINGAKQNAFITSTFKLFKNTWNFSPSITLDQYFNFQQTTKSFDATSNTLKTNTLQKPVSFHRITSNFQFTSQVYTYYKFIGKSSPIVRHILTPSISYTFNPKTQNFNQNYIDANNNTIFYSPFERSLYSALNSAQSNLIRFDATNTFELKHKSSKDTLSGFKKTKLIEALTLNGFYNFEKDSMKLSDISLSLRLNPIEVLSIVANSTFSPYAWDPTTLITKKEYAISNSGKIGRIISTQFNTTLTLTAPKNRKKINENKLAFTDKWNSEVLFFKLHPEQFIDFEIPWKINISHVLSIDTKTMKKNSEDKNITTTHTAYLTGDINLTKRWKISSMANIDLVSKQITNANLTLTRNLHCWNISFFATPIGTNKSFLIRLYANGKLLQDAKLELRKPPSIF